MTSGETTGSPAAAPTLRVAIGGSAGGRIDQHFGQAEEFLIYDITGSGAQALAPRRIDHHALPGEDRRATIVRMLADCRLLLVAKVGAAPQKLLADAGITATDRHAGQPVAAILAELAASAG